MKSIIYFFCIIVLFQSCYGYKNYSQSSKELSSGKLYKFDLNDGKEFRILIDSLDQTSVYGQLNEKSLIIPHTEIKTIETAKKSTGRTVGLVSIIAVGTAVIVGVALFINSLTRGFTSSGNSED